ncbi:hypothetical protein DM793_19725 [Paenarthrobacter nitroguajacolicus]|uniref:hypothetical protein n=1 Tax=Paenarthrobacter nitroguajacolicus TaxID=211146 RepID=UPI0015C13213|nr:hypothetical protein [Paenarthrobacter nitroguajacolicus]NWL13497.1 hypothetical protein [Paenarthrobacter nitroguajacolicus]
MTRRLVSVDDAFNVPDNLNVRDVNLPDRLQDTALSATFAPKWKASTAYTAGQNVTAPDGNVVRAKANFTSSPLYDSSNWEYGTIPGGANVPTAKSATDTRAGVWEYTHNSKTGYLYHLLAGSNFGGGAIFAIGHDADDGTGTALLAEKANGKGLVIDQRSTKTSASAYGFHATNASTAAPLVRLEQVVTDAAPALQVLALGSPGTDQVLASFGDGSGTAGRIYGDTGQLRWMRNVEVRDKNSSTLSRITVRGDDGVANPSPVHHDRTGIEFRTYAGSGTSYWPKRVFHTGTQLKIQGSATVVGVGTVPGAWVDGLTFEFNTGAAKLGFYGATPAAKPTGVAVDAAAIHAALVTLGLIAA